MIIKSIHIKLLIISLTFLSLSYSLTFEDPVLLHPTDYSSEGKATVVDWDNDGLKDILFGERVPSSETSNSNVGFWKNSGTQTNPSFSDAGNLEADGSTISIEVG